MGTCSICGKTEWDVSENYCSDCMRRYELFCEHIPENWRKLLGNSQAIPSYYLWKKEQLIMAQLERKEITQQEAEERARALAEEVRRIYRPTPQEIAEQRAALEAQRAAQEKELSRSILPTDI